MVKRYQGIDFSGSPKEWQPSKHTSNVWIATIEECREMMELISLQRVQQLSGKGRPFSRLTTMLADSDCSATAIDAPFSMPWWFFGRKFTDHSDLITQIDQLPLDDDSDFPSKEAFADCVRTDVVKLKYTKPLRVTESYWRGRGVNVRSTVWIGARPGASFASACIKLLAQAELPIWPWAKCTNGLLVEAFPAAQLKHWGLPFDKYNKKSGQRNRTLIVNYLINKLRLKMGSADLATIRESADALDAVLCSYAARAVNKNRVGVEIPSFNVWQQEGWIAVHD